MASGIRRIRREAVDAVVLHARDAAPLECCGMLVGTGTTIVDAVRGRNIAPAPETRFLIDPRDHIDARRAARRRGFDVVGFYHSHPRSGAMPSATDVAEAAYADHLYLIVGLATDPPEVSLFELGEIPARNFLPVPVVTVG